MFNKAEWAKKYNKDYYQKHKDILNKHKREERAKKGAKPRNRNKQIESKKQIKNKLPLKPKITRKRYPKQVAIWLSMIKSKYRLSPKDWTNLVLKSNGRCEMCIEQFKSGRDCCTDHNHKTGKVRGLLCLTCNLKLGIVEKGLDPINFFEVSLKYLESN